jgi:hypothetical protein
LGKQTALADFDTVYSLSKDNCMDPRCFMALLGKTAPCSTAQSARAQLIGHWDRVAAALQSGSAGTQSAVSQFLQTLPGLLESAAMRLDSEVVRHDAETNRQNAAIKASDLLRSKLVALARSEVVARDERIAGLLNSPSWRVTKPARFVMRNLKRLLGR